MQFNVKEKMTIMLHHTVSTREGNPGSNLEFISLGTQCTGVYSSASYRPNNGFGGGGGGGGGQFGPDIRTRITAVGRSNCQQPRRQRRPSRRRRH